MIISKYKNKRVIVTGHTGFKGSWLTLWLYLLGAKVLGISLHSKKNDPLNEQVDNEDAK